MDWLYALFLFVIIYTSECRLWHSSGSDEISSNEVLTDPYSESMDNLLIPPTHKLPEFWDSLRYNTFKHQGTQEKDESDQDFETQTLRPLEPVQELHSKRISATKCKEYSDLARKQHSHRSVRAIQSYVTRGKNAKLKEFPHVAAIDFNKAKTYQCGGSLISDRFVLTAAHCLRSMQPTNITIRLGEHNVNDTVSDGAKPKDFRVAKILIFSGYNSRRQYHDIALLRLDKKVKFTSSIWPACLWTSESFGTEKHAVAAGWGIINSTTQERAGILQTTTLDILDNKKCNKTMSNIFNNKWEGFSDDQICAGKPEEGKDTCQGDSGTPLQIPIVLNNLRVYYVIGVTAKGYALCGTGPAVYTKVFSYLGWIEKIVWRKNVLE